MHRKFQHKVILILISICGASIIFHHYQRNIVSVQQSQGRPKFILKDIKCSKILQGDAEELKKVHAWNLKRQYVIHPSFYINKTKFCHSFQEEMGYDSYPVTDDEKNFPIAFSLILHKDIKHFEILLHTIYRPQNIYCLHVDQKSPQDYKDAIWKIADCFPNVFVASKLEAVFYASYSRLQADLNCMEDLLQKSVTWKYLINIAGQSFPLKTNLELVNILQIYNGSNDIEGITGKRALIYRAEYVHKINAKGNLERLNVHKTAPPHGIKLVKGSAYGVFSRAFVKFVVSSNISKDLLNWMKDIYSPDEYFWATLHHSSLNPHLNVPGSYKGDPNLKKWLASYSAWQSVDPCNGKWVRQICVFSASDLKRLFRRYELFANKFHLTYDPLAVLCLKELLYNRTMNLAISYDLTFYKKLKFVKH